MERDAILDRLRAHEAELRARGVLGLALFGSSARGEARPGSDVDIAVRLQGDAAARGLAGLRQLDTLRARLAQIVGRPVDLVEEPVERARLSQEIERDRAVAF